MNFLLQPTPYLECRFVDEIEDSAEWVYKLLILLFIVYLFYLFYNLQFSSLMVDINLLWVLFSFTSFIFVPVEDMGSGKG